jgi:hypothetical protein
MFSGRALLSSSEVELRASLTARSATFTNNAGRTLSMGEFANNILGAARLVVPLSLRHRVGLGFLDKDGTGLEVLLPIGEVQNGNAQAELMRYGESMEGGSRRLPLSEEWFSEGQTLELTLILSKEGRVKFRMRDRTLLDELAGFPLQFEGYPVVSCQNLKCAIHSVEFSQPL